MLATRVVRRHGRGLRGLRGLALAALAALSITRGASFALGQPAPARESAPGPTTTRPADPMQKSTPSTATMRPAGPDAPRLPSRIEDGSKIALPPMVVPQGRAAPDRRPMYVGAGLIVLALVFWWNRRRRDRFEREDHVAPHGRAGHRDADTDDVHAAAQAADRDTDADDLHAADRDADADELAAAARGDGAAEAEPAGSSAPRRPERHDLP